MAYSRVTRTQNGKGALDYAYGHNGKGHNENAMRNQLVSGVNMIDGVTYLEQMQHYWNRARVGHKTQIIRVVQSFSLKEFDPTKQSDIEKAHEIGREFASEFYPNRQAVVFTQIDGKSGLVHNHILINDVSMEDSKGCNKLQYYFPQIKKWTNEIAGKYIELDFGKGKTEDKTTQTERAKREQGAYVWKDDLKSRVHDAMIEAESQDDFEQKLPQHGVNFEKKFSKKYGEGYTYELMDLSNVPEGVKVPNRALKVRSRKLGDSYGIEALNYILQLKSEARQTYEPEEEIIDDIAHEIEDVNEPPEEIIEDVVATEVVNHNPFDRLSPEQLRKALDEFNLGGMGISVSDEEKRLKTQNTASKDNEDTDEQPDLQEMSGTVTDDVDSVQYQQHMQNIKQIIQDEADSDDMDGKKAKLNNRLANLQVEFGDMLDNMQDDNELSR